MSDLNGPNFSAGDEIIGKKASYRVIQSMGGGAFAKPYLVENVDNRTKAILKFNTRVNEAEIVRMVSQSFAERNEKPLVVDVIDYPVNEFPGWWGHIEAVADGHPCCERKPSELQALYIFLEFARLMKYCATRGIAYLDVKPLTHIFWQENEENHKPEIKVIDWNAGTKGATFHELRRDLLEFCRSLPELFTGQEIEKFKVNPLYWNLDYGANSQLPVTYATWIMLATLSLDWAGPTIPELKDLLQLPNSTTTSRTVQPLVDAWDAIIEHIRNTIERNTYPTRQDFNPGFSVSPRPKVKKGFEAIADAIKVERPSELAAPMEFQAKEIAQWLRENKDSLTINRPDNEPAILALRLLSPTNQQFAILLSSFEIWKNAAHISSLEVDPDWQKFIQAIVESDFDQLSLIKQNDLPKMKENILARSNISTNDGYAEEWANRLSALDEEIDIWIALNVGEENDILALPSSHPVVKNKHIEIKKRQTTNQDFERHLKQLKEAYFDGDFAKIKTLLSELENSSDIFSADQTNQLVDYQDAVQLFETISSLSNSWNQDDLQKCDVFYSLLPDEKKVAFKDYVEAASKRQKLLSEISNLYLIVDDNLSIEQATLLNIGKYLPAAETRQYKELIKALKRWSQKQFEDLESKVSNGLRENRLDRELVQNALAQTADLRKLVLEISLNNLIPELENLTVQLREAEIGIDKFFQQLDAYRSLLKRNQPNLQDTQPNEDFQKLPGEIKDILKAEADQEVSLVAAINSNLEAKYANIDKRLEENHVAILNEIIKIYEDAQRQATDFEQKPQNTGRQLSAEPPTRGNKLLTFLNPAFLSAISILLILFLGIVFIAISREMRQTQESIQSLAEFQHAFATAMMASPVVSTTEDSPIQTEVSQPSASSATPSSGTPNPAESTTPNVANPPIGSPFLYDTGLKTVTFSNENGEAIFRTQGTITTLNLYLIKEDTANQGKYVGLFAFVLDKNIKDISAPKFIIKDSVFLYIPEDIKTEFIVIVKPPIEAIPISEDSANEGHVVWLEGWIK